jgi:hypothetical protein
MERKFSGLGGFTVRMPTLEELTALWRAKVESDSQRKFVKAVLVQPSLAEIRKTHPAAVTSIVDAVLEVYGAVYYNAEDLEEDEMDDLGEEFLKAYVSAKEKSAALGKTNDLLVIRVGFSNPKLSKDLGKPLAFILRRPKESEVDDFQRDHNSFHLAKNLVEKLCVHGPLATVSERFPGLWMGLAVRSISRAGSNEDIELDLA